MSFFLKRSAAWAGVWCGGDFFAQFYSAHKASAAKRLKGEKREGPRPTGGQMLGMLDKERLAAAAVFGALVGPCVLQFERLLPRIFGNLDRNATGCLCALGLQQLVMTPVMTWTYFNAMTAMKGGFSDPSFMEVHAPRERHDVKGIERYIFEDVMPYPILTSWAVYVPLYMFAFFGPFRGAGFLSGCILFPWCSMLSYCQETRLL